MAFSQWVFGVVGPQYKLLYACSAFRYIAQLSCQKMASFSVYRAEFRDGSVRDVEQERNHRSGTAHASANSGDV